MHCQSTANAFGKLKHTTHTRFRHRAPATNPSDSVQKTKVNLVSFTGFIAAPGFCGQSGEDVSECGGEEMMGEREHSIGSSLGDLRKDSIDSSGQKGANTRKSLGRICGFYVFRPAFGIKRIWQYRLNRPLIKRT